MKKKEVAVYIGRFVPFHLGHKSVLDKLIDEFEYVIVVLGSIDAPRNINTPWKYNERAEYISQHYTEEQLSKMFFTGIRDTLYQSNRWVKRIYSAVYDICANNLDGYENCNVTVAGSVGRDSSEEYENLFKSWNFFNTAEHRHGNINATDIRMQYFNPETNMIDHEWEVPLTPLMKEWLMKFKNDVDYEKLRADFKYLAYEQTTCENVKYGQNYYTADALVTQSGHVLLIQRKSEYGNGLWALPGGHVNKNETSKQASIRELKEETNIHLQNSILEKSIIGKEIFEEPERSPRGRLGHNKLGRSVTVAYHFKLSDEHPLPRVKAGSDAGEVRWFDFAQVENMKEQLFEDHYDIIEHFLHK